jgi:DNA-binding MarR family transcriptional regulator
MAKRRGVLDELRALQASSLGFVLIRCAQVFNERGMARVNAEAGAPVLREAHTRLIPHLMVEEGVRITTLAQKTGVTKQAVHQLVADLLELGVVKVSADPDDARARRVTLTEVGVHAMEHGTGKLLELEAELAKTLGKKHLRELHAALTKLLPVLEEGSSREA